MGHCWRRKDKFISNILLWTPSHGHTSVHQPTTSHLQQLCMDTGCSFQDLLEVMDDTDEWEERVKKIHANNVTWGYKYIQACMCVCVCVCVYIELWLHTYFSVHMFKREYVCVCIYIYIYIYIHTHTYTHTHTCSWYATKVDRKDSG